MTDLPPKTNSFVRPPVLLVVSCPPCRLSAQCHPTSQLSYPSNKLTAATSNGQQLPSRRSGTEGHETNDADRETKGTPLQNGAHSTWGKGHVPESMKSTGRHTPPNQKLTEKVRTRRTSTGQLANRPARLVDQTMDCATSEQSRSDGTRTSTGQHSNRPARRVRWIRRRRNDTTSIRAGHMQPKASKALDVPR